MSTKRDAVLDTAERLFYAEGFHATGIDRVVTEAGVARMTLYNHFPSKEALVESVLERRYGRYLDDLGQAVETADKHAAVTALLARHAEWLMTVSDRGCIVLKAIGEYEQHYAPLADQGRRLKRELLTVIARAVESDGHEEASVLAERLLVVMEGADALVPVLGSKAAVAHLRTIAAAVLRNPNMA